MSRAADIATLTSRRSTRFVAWTRAWRAGIVGYDEIADEIAGDEEHVVVDAPGTWTDQTLRESLSMLAKLHPDEIRLVLPAAGDPVGLPGPGAFTGAALLAGEGVIASRYGFVPETREYTSGSGDVFATVAWQVYELPEAPRGFHGPSAAEAEADLNAALASATTTLTRLDVAQWRPELAGAIQALRKPDTSTDLPPGYDPRSRRLFARASVLDRVLVLADENAPGGAINGHEARTRDEALRPLAAACRRALVAACNAPLDF
ncbi:MAG TPA: hypothetical protein VGJ28_09645 [Micromonosporaceae bacterium]|jgi:hypothetical protein